MSNSSIRPIDRTLSGATTPGENGPGINSNEGVLCILQLSKARASSSDGLQDTRGGEGLTPPQRYSRDILQPQPTELL